MPLQLLYYNRPEKPDWCPACGNFGIINALKMALVELKISPHQVLVVSGIGCSSKLPHWLNTYGFHTLHGRPLPVATGAKLANHKLTVIAVGGDGDGYGLGMGHFMHSLRRNLDLVYLVHNNQIYGLTKGQTSPTSPTGFISSSTPDGVIEVPFNPIAAALSCAGTFIARGFSDNIQHLKELIKKAIIHKGFGFIDVLQPCVTFNKQNNRVWYKERIYELKEVPTSRVQAIEIALQTDKLGIGLFWQEQKSTYEGNLPQIKDMALVEQDIKRIDLRMALNNLV